MELGAKPDKKGSDFSFRQYRNELDNKSSMIGDILAIQRDFYFGILEAYVIHLIAPYGPVISDFGNLFR